MAFGSNIPWDKYGLIVELAKRLEGISPQFGKTALQKLVFLLGAVYQVPCQYEYQLYTYGPYCAELAADVEYVAAMGGVKLWQVNSGYAIKPAENAQWIKEKADDFFHRYDRQLDQLITKFGTYNARELELRSTLIYLAQCEELTEMKLLHQLIDLKPYFVQTEVLTAIQDLAGQGFIHLL